MPFIEDMQALDGREIIYTPSGGMPRTITGMLQEFTELVDGESVDVVATAPVLSVRAIDVPNIKTSHYCWRCGA